MRDGNPGNHGFLREQWVTIINSRKYMKKSSLHRKDGGRGGGKKKRKIGINKKNLKKRKRNKTKGKKKTIETSVVGKTK